MARQRPKSRRPARAKKRPRRAGKPRGTSSDPVKRSLELASRARRDAERLIESVRPPIVVLDDELRVKSSNLAFSERFQVPPAETTGKAFPGQFAESLPALDELTARLRKVLEGGEDLADFEFSAVVRNAGMQDLVANARAIDRQGGGRSS